MIEHVMLNDASQEFYANIHTGPQSHFVFSHRINELFFLFSSSSLSLSLSSDVYSSNYFCSVRTIRNLCVCELMYASNNRGLRAYTRTRYLYRARAYGLQGNTCNPAI